MIRAPKICGGSHIRAGLSGYVAELSSAMLGAELGLPVAHLDNHASYIDHWLKLLKEDDRAILTAAAKAEEVSHLLLRLGGHITAEQADEDPADTQLAA